MRALRGLGLPYFVTAFLFAGCFLSGSSKFSPPEIVPGSRFGSAVAATGSFGLVGAPGASEAGAVYVYDLSDDNRVLETVIPEAATEGDDFGKALDADGDILVVGAPLHEHDGFIAGAAFVYRRDGTSGAWIEEAILATEVSGDLDYFGTSISVSGDHIAVGTPGDDGAESNAGAVYVYSEPDFGWALSHLLVAPDAGPSDRCGSSVDVRGERILIGCPNGFGSGVLSGVAYLFRLVDSTYVLEQVFGPSSDESGQLFGSAVSLSDNRVLIGAPGPKAAYPSGSVHVFSFDGTEWLAAGILSADDQVASRGFGAVLSVDGAFLVVGAQRKEGEHLAPGSAFVYELTGASWTLQSTLEGSDIDRADGFGSTVVVHDGHILVGAAGDADGGSNAGAAYHFTRSGTTWK